jgi:hypothetical protein
MSILLTLIIGGIMFLCGAVFGASVWYVYRSRRDKKIISEASAKFMRMIPEDAVVITGEPGRNGGGRGGDGIFWCDGLAVTPGEPGTGAKGKTER